MTRASLMLLAMIILHVLLGWLCLVVASGERRSRSLQLWGWGMLVYSAGLLITIPPFLPFDLRKVVGNALIALAPVLLVCGLVADTGFRFSRKWLTIGFVASVLPIVINHLRDEFVVLVDLVSPTPLALVLFVVAIVVLLRRPPADAPNAARYLAGILTFTVVVLLVRISMIVASIGGTNDRERADLVISLFSIAQLVTAVGCTLGLLWVEVRMMQAALERVAYTDALTGLPNRRATVQRFDAELSRATRLQQPLALVVFDVDHFKRFNDTHGHQIGDEVLKHVAAVASHAIRNDDVLGRIGGEEFVLLMVGQGQDEAVEAAERVRRLIAEMPVVAEGNELPVTVSGGLALYPVDGATWDGLFAIADERLYEAKRSGRNRIVAAAAAA